MLKILVFQHVAVEHPGSFREVIAAQGHSMHQVELDEGASIPPLDWFDALLVMGGPMDVWQEALHPWLQAEKAAIRAWVAAGRPYLGMCLGAQLLAETMGGRVALMTAAPEVGMSQVRQTAADPIFAGIDETFTCFQWHGAEVTALPPGARLLAAGSGCAVQGFAIGGHAYGLQFHMELTEATAAEWGAMPEYAAALDAAQGPGAMDRLSAEVDQHLPALRQAAHLLFANFLEIATRTVRQKNAN